MVQKLINCSLKIELNFVDFYREFCPLPDELYFGKLQFILFRNFVMPKECFDLLVKFMQGRLSTYDLLNWGNLFCKKYANIHYEKQLN